MPFGDYKDFADCVKRNQDKDNPEAYCGQIQHQVEGGDKESEDKTNKDVLYKRVETPILFKMGTDPETKLPVMWAYISSTLRDRDGDRFHKTVLEGWTFTINKGKINIGTDHGHSWEDSLGVWTNAEVRTNPQGDDIKSAKNYLFVKGRLEDPNINPKVKLLVHKADIGEQISLSIAANPAAKNWYDLEVEKDGSNTRVIKSADLLKADIVGEPANPDARMIGIFLKHAKCNEGKCLPDCEGCYMEKDFAECIKKSMIAPNTKIEQVHSSLVNENANKNRMTLSKQDQDILNKEHGCKEGERYCPDEGKCMPAEEMKSVNKDQADCPPGHKYNAESGKCEKEEMKSLSPDVEKLLEYVKAVATQPAPQTGGDPNGTPPKGQLESIVQQALAQMRADATAKLGDLQFNIPAAQISVTPGISGSSGAQPQTTSSPAPTLQPPIPSLIVQATPGQSGAGPQPAPAQSTPAAPETSNPSPIPPVQVQASSEPKVKKKITVKQGVAGILLNEKRTMEEVEKARKEVTPKHENPGEIVTTIIDTSKLIGEVKTAAEQYNKVVLESQAAQVKQIYTPNDLVKMSEEGKLLKELDQNNNFGKVVKVIAGTGKIRKQIQGSILLTKNR